MPSKDTLFPLDDIADEGRAEEAAAEAEPAHGASTPDRPDDACISCSGCCPFRHATRDEATGIITIRCGNAARRDAGTPTLHEG